MKGALTRPDAVSPAEVAASAGNGDRFWPDLDLLFRNSERMRAVENIVRRAADTNATILLQGESGTGKEMVAKAIHYISGRRDRPFLKVNCASLPGDLLESELFGHEKGAFTGAHRRKPGKFELAHRGTFLLDEIGEMPLGLQAKLLHVLQDGKFFRVGGSELIDTDVRLVAATNKELAAIIQTGQFREDLYYRLNVVTISVPPLRERREEIPLLVNHFRRKFCMQYERDSPDHLGRDDAASPGIPVAGQRARAREHDQASRRAAERRAPARGDLDAAEPALAGRGHGRVRGAARPRPRESAATCPGCGVRRIATSGSG